MKNEIRINDQLIGIVGLGYVGLPLAIEFQKHNKVIAFDRNEIRVRELLEGVDSTFELNGDELKNLENIKFTSNSQDLSNCNVFIIAVPTPVDDHKQPDLGPLINATERVGELLKRGNIVIYESTVYPGCTEEECVPVLEKTSGLKFNVDFYCGYSPERINPGDAAHRLKDIVKIVSGSTDEVLESVASLYELIIRAGVHRASSIKVAEAAKVIENTQRDVNIALINELAIIFDKLSLNTSEVLAAASSKWNFMKFYPGLVGGHCIGVDPYYLTFKAQSLGYHPEVILSGRRINDSMSSYLAQKTIKLLIKNKKRISSAKVAIFGVTFKENCTDIRNSKVFDLISELNDFGCDLHVCDPMVECSTELKRLNLKIVNLEGMDDDFDAVILAVPHQKILDAIADFFNKQKNDYLVIDVKSALTGYCLKNVWSL